MSRAIPLASLTPLALLLACLAAGPAYGGTCSSPTGNEADIVYNSASHTYQFCNGTNWLAFGPGGCFAPQTGTYQPTAPSGSGYFVLTSGTYNGDLGSNALSSANSTCLTELTTNTGWLGYSTANANGQLVADKVKAFLCTANNDGDTCNNLMPLTTYYFANAGNGAAGGASFTTDSNGIGPNDSANWSGSTYFGGSYTYYSNRGQTSNTAWTNTVYNNGAEGDCDDYTSSSSGVGADLGSSSSTTNSRWYYAPTSNDTCNLTVYLVCYVNP